MDAALLSRGGIPTAVFGPGGAGAHAAEEWVLISDVAACAEILARTALNFS
jgi:acetylornithine deacetylase